MKKALLIAVALVVTTVSLDAQPYRPRPNNPRPPWGDVCCGGPCCSKPMRPGR